MRGRGEDEKGRVLAVVAAFWGAIGETRGRAARIEEVIGCVIKEGRMNGRRKRNGMVVMFRVRMCIRDEKLWMRHSYGSCG